MTCHRLLLLCLILVTIVGARADDVQLLNVIAQAGPQGSGSKEAQAACRELAKRDLSLLPSLLSAMDTGNPVAANWYRTVFEQLVRREMTGDSADWPTAFLKEYVSDVSRRGRPRRRVLKLLDTVDPSFRRQWIRGRLTDAEFRHDAVAAVLEEGDLALQNDQQEAARSAFLLAFDHARDRQQVITTAAKLRTVGEQPDTIAHLGLVIDWWLTGPFAAPDKSGFQRTFAPENEEIVDLQAAYERIDASPVSWIRHTTDDPLGRLNLIDVFGKTDEAVAYAWTEFNVPKGIDAQLRCSADDCCLVWLNGQTVSEHEQWLNGTRFDRFTQDITLRKGLNRILVKVCQGPQHRNPEVFNNWSLQLRLCDADGRGIEFESARAGEDTE